MDDTVPKELRREVGSDFRPPFFKVDCQITARCDARCAFCPAWRDDMPRPDDLPGQAWIDLVQRMSEFTEVQMFCIGGGEPLTYPDLYQVIRGVAELKVNSVLVTNGRLLSPKTCDKLLEAGLTELNVSLDSFAELHDEMRGRPGIFDSALAGVRYIKEQRPQMRVAASTLITGRNLEQLPRFVDWLKAETPIDHIGMQAYNQLLPTGRDWDSFREDPIWPQDMGQMEQVMEALKERAAAGLIANPPQLFDKYKEYFRDPNQHLRIRCSAGMFHLAVSNDGNVAGCILDPPVGNITHDDPVELYRRVFPSVRQKARHCHINCHFLINCNYYLNWDELDEADARMTPRELVQTAPLKGSPVPELGSALATAPPPRLGRPSPDAPLTPGRVVIPPEIRQIVIDRSIPSGSLLRYEEHEEHDVIGRNITTTDDRFVPGFYENSMPCIFFAGETSEVHRWGVELDEDDWFKQNALLEHFVGLQAAYHVIVGVRRTNMHRLPQILDYILQARGQEPLALEPLNLRDPYKIGARFTAHLEQLNQVGRPIGIAFETMDAELGPLFETIARAPHVPGFNHKEYLLALGPVCKDVFTGPRYLLLDLCGKCNTDCIYCRQFSPLNSEETLAEYKRMGAYEVLSLDLVERSLRQGHALGAEKVLLVGRGEPTLHPQFAQILELVHELDLHWVISTNGILLDRCMESYLDLRCDSVTVSLSYASEETFQQLRPGTSPRMRERIERNMIELARRRQSAGRPQITALYAINKLNCHEVLQMAHHAKRLGADAIWYQLVHLSDFSKDQLGMNAEESARVQADLEQARELCQELGLEWHNFIDFEIKHYDAEAGDWSSGGMLAQGCYVGWHFAFVNLTKEVFMCCGGQTMGVLEGEGKDLGQLWYSDRWRRYRNDALILHVENPLDINGVPIYNAYCESCDNHDQHLQMLGYLGRYGLAPFVER